MRDMRAVGAVMLALVMSGSLQAASLPVVLDHQGGDIRQLRGDDILAIENQEAIAAGATVFTGKEGRAEFSVNGAPSLSLGGSSAILFHSAPDDILQAALTSGSLEVDARSKSGQSARDIRLRVGTLRVRVVNARVWVEKTPETAQVCLLSGKVELRAGERPLMMDTLNQCVRQTGQVRQWTMVPQQVLTERIALTRVPRTVGSGGAEVAAAKPVEVAAQSAPVEVEAEVPAPEVVQRAEPLEAEVAETVLEAIVEPEPEPEPRAEPESPSLDIAVAETVAEDEAVAPEGVPEPVAAAAEPVEQTLVVEEVPSTKPVGTAMVFETPSEEALTQILTVPSVKGLAVRVGANLQAPEIDPVEVAVAESASEPETVELETVEPEEAPELDTVIAAAESEADSAMQEDVEVESSVEVLSEEAQMESEAEDASDEQGAPETDTAPDEPKRWSVVLASHDDLESAVVEEERLRAKGLDVQAREYRVGERHGYRIGIGRYETQAQAQEALAELQSLRPTIEGWLARY